MPIYEYECRNCGFQFQVLIMNLDEERDLRCENCGKEELKRLISRAIYHISESDRLEAYDPNAPKSDSFYRDTRNIGLHAKKRAKQMGIDLGSSFEEKLEKLRTDPGSVIRDSD